MDILFTVLHVATAVFIVGPMAVLPMTAMRSVRAGNASQVGGLAKSAQIFTWLSLVVFVLGFAAMGTSEQHLTFLTPWILWAVICYLIAFLVSLFLVIPTLNKAAEEIRESNGKGASYPKLAVSGGIVSILLLVVVVLMVWRP